MEIVLLILLKNYIIYLVLSHVAVIPLMVLAAFGRCEIKLFLRNSIVCYGVTILLGGCAQAVENTWEIHQMPFLAGALGVLICISLFRFFGQERRTGRQLYPVELSHNGKVFMCAGLLDTGNLLREPMKNAPVSIVKEDILQCLNVKEQDRCGIVLYQTLGKNTGTLETYCIDRLSIKQNGSWHHTSPAIVAAAPAALLQGKRFEVILNSEL